MYSNRFICLTLLLLFGGEKDMTIEIGSTEDECANCGASSWELVSATSMTLPPATYECEECGQKAQESS